MDEANRCDRIGFIHDGRLIAEGKPDELLSITGSGCLEDAFMQFAAGARREAER